MAGLHPLIRKQTRNAIRALSQYALVRAAYVFGSQADGTAGAFSDIDLGVFIENLSEWILPKRAHAAANVQKEAGDEIELHFFSADALTRPIQASFADFVLRHGIRVFPFRR